MILKKPILILGYERSGTTLLRRIVSMHTGFDKNLVHEKYKVFTGCNSYEELKEKLSWDKASIECGIKFPYCYFSVVKNSYNKFSNFFNSFYVIHIIRNPVNAINSQVKTFKKQTKKCIKYYRESVLKSLNFLSEKDNILFVKYENIISNPFLFVKKLYEWIGNSPNDNHIKKVISKKRPWTANTKRLMGGLRYFDKIQNTKSKIILKKKYIDKIKSWSPDFGY